MSLDSAVTVAALALVCLSFGLFWYFTLSQLNAAKQANASVDGAVVKTEAIAIGDVTKLLESAAKLIDGDSESRSRSFRPRRVSAVPRDSSLYRQQGRYASRFQDGRGGNVKSEVSRDRNAKAGRNGKIADAGILIT